MKLDVLAKAKSKREEKKINDQTKEPLTPKDRQESAKREWEEPVRWVH